MLKDAIEIAPSVMLGDLAYRALEKPSRDIAIRQPPCNGRQHALVLGGGEKHRTVFCPFTLQAWEASIASYELTIGIGQPRLGAKDSIEEFSNPKRWAARILANWKNLRACGISFNADAAAVVLARLGEEPPADEKDDQGEVRIKGGKEAVETRAFKKMKRDGKRAVFLLHALEAPEDQPFTIRHYMDKFDMTRNNVLSYWYGLNKDQNVAYTIAGDAILFKLPVDDVEELLA